MRQNLSATFAQTRCPKKYLAEQIEIPAEFILEVGKAVKKFALALLLAGSLAPAASMAQVGVFVHVGPPAPIIEHYGPRPHPGYVWIAGYHRWDGNRYEWVRGYWAMPPRPGAVWVPYHWTHRRRGWVLAGGHWRYR